MSSTLLAYIVGVAGGLLAGIYLTRAYYRDKMRGRHRRQSQVSGPGSVNVQVGGDCHWEGPGDAS